ncbi:class II D-tagatose-bisphosphate aldolase, non-catalytic subunit [Anoxybacterium hadale]|uniref:Class II D-tagatose-bisphosphate aldolase, non-catalytic subunit n=1 Tax=Anoxybacterium hadale TaxID=3408580 RepID=A0ACD1AFM5_9FIRM|nr:class II D-tagatose-bisphosphate aldolase, non-catalytic subunit [Clostridiales bacterium]
MNHPLQTLLNTRTPDHPIGIPSLCSANEWVIDAGMLWAQKHQIPLLLEATANQVNQFGGYTGMTPQDFFDFVEQRALKNKFPLSSLFLGGDHLGPMVWKNETEESAMNKAETLVRDFIMAGFTKIHLDASMPLADDEITQGLDPSVVARRAARLAAACEQAYRSLHVKNSDAVPPIYVVGSEVPIAGGAHDKEDTISVTTPKNFHEEVTLFQDAFEEHGLHEAWKRVIAVVVQPGVEFGNDTIMDYDAEAASALCHALDDYPGLVFEGHSTDYQRPEALHTMISNGVAILKVGPALTFALREGLYALQSMEKILFSDSPEKQSHYCEVLERVMRENPNYWKTYFDGPERMLSINRIFGLSDRSRYYLGNPEVKAAEEKLLHNLSQTDIPLGLLHQFLPDQYRKVRQNTLSTQPSALLLDKICALLDDYR